MPNLVSDGEKRYAEANRAELQRVYEQRVAEIRGRHTPSVRVNAVQRGVRNMAMRWELARARREVFGTDNLYLTDPDSECC